MEEKQLDRKGTKMLQDILVDCVVKPVIATAVTIGTMVAINVVANKIDEHMTKKKQENIIDKEIVKA